jgi:hypothetical protein
MPQRKCTKTKTEIAKPCKRISLPIEMETYCTLVADRAAFRHWVDEMIGTYPALFPAAIGLGYTLHDQRASEKLPAVMRRRIKLKALDAEGQAQVFTIAPSGVWPYLTGYSDEVEKALFLRRFGVPYWALAYVFGRDEQYWYRLTSHLGRFEIVATTVQAPGHLPVHLLADEKHARLNGEKAYIATTVGQECVLGAAVALAADEPELTAAYGIFQQEACHLVPDYQPETVNTDGWLATQKAWCALFPLIVMIECFLHAFLKIRQGCQKRLKTIYGDIQQQVWDIYHAPNPATFQQRMNAFQAWAQQTVTGTALESIEKLSAKAERFLLAFKHPEAYRTSNMLDRHMLPMTRWLEHARHFHGHWTSAELQVRSWAVLHNFWPYCPRTKISQDFQAPAHQLNGFVYHDNWLHNLLISSSHATALC